MLKIDPKAEKRRRALVILSIESGYLVICNDNNLLLAKIRKNKYHGKEENSNMVELFLINYHLKKRYKYLVKTLSSDYLQKM